MAISIFLIMSAAAFSLYRNNAVFKFRKRMLEEEDVFLDQRIANGLGFDRFRRYDAMPKYFYMVFHFWIPVKKWEKPLSDFYK